MLTGLTRGDALYILFFVIGIPLIFLVLVFLGIHKLLSRWIIHKIIRLSVSLFFAIVATVCIYPFMLPLMEIVTDLIRHGYISNY